MSEPDFDRRFEYRFDYADDSAAWAAFCDFSVAVHDLDLRLWEDRVGIDPDFVSFSFFDGDRVVASTSIYSLDMILDGHRRRVAQLSTVGTREAYRRRGLNAELTRRALAWAETSGHSGSFLFSDTDARGFYRRQGYVEIAEWIARVPAHTAPRPGARALRFTRDEPLIRRLIESRVPVSRRVGVRSPKLELFHLLYENAGELHYVEELDLLACTEASGATLKVYDLITPELPPWSDIEPWLLRPLTNRIEFWIPPDLLELEDPDYVESHDNCLHVRPSERLFEPPFVVPWTAHA